MSLADIARSINESPQNFSNKLKRGSFSVNELQKIADALDVDFNVSFKLKNNKTILLNDNPKIKNKDVLNFCILCIEVLKKYLKISGKESFSLLAEKTDLLYSYIAKHYDVLHTQGEQYIVDDLKELLSNKKVQNG